MLTLRQDAPVAPSEEQAADSLVVADVLSQAMFSIQARTPLGVLAEGLSDVSAHRAEVHQASGMLAVQLGITVSDAQVRIRAYSYGTEQSIAAVACEVVARRLHLGDDGGGMNHSGNIDSERRP